MNVENHNVKNHKIVLEDTSPGEMARFRQFFINIWREQIEDEKNAGMMDRQIVLNKIKQNCAKLLEHEKKYTTTWLGERILKSDFHDLNNGNNYKYNIVQSLTNKAVEIDQNAQEETYNSTKLKEISLTNDYFYKENGTFDGKENELGNKENLNYKYNSKELQDELNLNVYDYGDRNYDPVLGRFMNIDPKAEKYVNLSPYNYAMDNLVYFIDADDMSPSDIIVLSYGNNENTGSGGVHRWGHQAILVGNDKKGWTYISLDGDWAGTKDDGSENDSYTIKKFDNLEQFSNSEYNTFKADYDDGEGTKNSERYDNGEIKQRYTEGFLIKTTDKQDKDMINAAKKRAKKGHNMMSNNCTVIPELALDAAGLKNGEWTPGRVIGSPAIPNFTPNAKQASIELRNEGKDVDNKLKRKK